MRKEAIHRTWSFYAINQNVEKLIIDQNPNYFSFMNYYPLPTLWRSNNSHARSHLPRRSIYFSPQWAVQSGHSLCTMEMWSHDVNCRYGNGNFSFMNTRMAVSPKSVIKQSYHLERTFLWLGWHWKGAKKRKKLEMVISTSSGHGHTSVTLCINRVMCGMQIYVLNNDYQQSNAFSLHNVSLVVHSYWDLPSQRNNAFTF